MKIISVLGELGLYSNLPKHEKGDWND